MYIFMGTCSDNLDVGNVWLYNNYPKIFDDENIALNWFMDTTGETKQYAKCFLKKCDSSFIVQVESKYM